MLPTVTLAFKVELVQAIQNILKLPMRILDYFHENHVRINLCTWIIVTVWYILKGKQRKIVLRRQNTALRRKKTPRDFNLCC